MERSAATKNQKLEDLISEDLEDLWREAKSTDL
jgi:uncharacterized protein YabN with tetrapyrrole methylase and pyrophosphatase domain